MFATSIGDNQAAAAAVSGGTGTAVASTSRVMIEADDSQCTPPVSTSPLRVLVPDVRFLSQACIASDSIAMPAATVAVKPSRFPKNCAKWIDVEASGVVAKHSPVVGLILPDGSKIPWSLAIGLGASWVEYDHGPYLGDDTVRPDLQESAFGNGVVISETEKGYATLVPVSMLPYWSGSQIASPQREDAPWPKPSPVFRLNGSTAFKDLFFGSDFELLSNQDTGATAGFSLQFEALARNANGQPIAASDCSEKLVFELSVEFPTAFQGGETIHKTPVEFFDITTQDQTSLVDNSMQVTLESGETYDFNALLEHYLSRINEQHYDLLFGASITLKAWHEGKSTEILDEATFSVYRFVDAADDEHHGRSIAMARTLGDGPEQVLRKRRVDVSVVDSAEFSFWVEGDKGFSFSRGDDGNPSYFVFDPKHTEVRRVDLLDHLVLARKSYKGSDQRMVTRLPIVGTAEPKNKIFFNIDGFEDALTDIYIRANTPEYAQHYGDYDSLPKKANGTLDIENTDPAQLEVFSSFLKVHPALVTDDERDFLVHPEQQAALAQQIQTRMSALWGPLMQGIEWSDSEDTDNTVKLLWKVRENKYWKNAFAFGVSLNESGGRQATDNYRDLAVLLRTIDLYNRAEAAYRLSNALNPGLRKDINIFVDSMLEKHRGSPGYSLTLSENEFVKGVAKTAVHETGHTFGLSHPVQSAAVAVEKLNEVQLLRIPAEEPEISIGFASDFLTIPRDKLERVNGQPSYNITLGMTKFQSIGVANMYENDPARSRGIYVMRCDEANEDFLWVTELVGPRCLTDDGSLDTELWVAVFANHLQGYDVPEITLSKGSVETFRNGKGYSYVEMNAVGNACQYAIIDTSEPKGPSELDVLTDIMHGGLNDVSGALSIQSKVSLELMKIALALNYSSDDVQHAIHSYRQQIAAFDAYGGNDFKPEITGDWDTHCMPLKRIESTTGVRFDLP